MVSLVAEWLLDQGERPAILTRGYGRRDRRDGVVVVSDGRKILVEVDQAGDEPFMLFLPDDVIVGVAFDTNTSGYHPIGSPGPYDALNVALLAGSAPAAGQDASVSELYLSGDLTGGDLIQIGVGGVGFPVRLDTAPSVPTDKAQCFKGAYADFGFSNQGQCISTVVANRGGNARVR